jgi:predicted DNA-binding protein
VSKRDEALAALESRDWSGAVVEQETRPASIVHGVRLPPELSERLTGEAARRGLKPSELLREIVTEALAERADDEVLTLRRTDLLRAIDTIAQRAA